MTGLHDRDRMKSGKALLMEYIAARSGDCNVSFLYEGSEMPERFFLPERAALYRLMGEFFQRKYSFKS